MSDFLVLDRDFKTSSVLDVYESVIWTDRYNEYGDFEVYTVPTKENVKELSFGRYIWSNQSEHLMIIENQKIETDVEMGNHLTITGRSLESILDRRIIWQQTTLNGKLQAELKKLLEQNLISPSDPNRKIPNFVFEETDDTIITDLTIEAQYTGDNLYTVIQDLCKNFSIGFKITLDKENNFVFKLYNGIDRSYEQTKNPYVVFSPTFENVINSNYYENSMNFRNVALVAGEDTGTDRKTVTVGAADSSNLDRRELYVDARDITSQTPDGGNISLDSYNTLLTTRGNERLTENKIEKKFEGEMETTQIYRYGEHFYMGDVVQLENEYNLTSRVRITEYIYNDDKDGFTSYPTFEVLENEEV